MKLSELNGTANLVIYLFCQCKLPDKLKGPVKLIKRVKIAHSLLQFVSNQFHVIILSLPM